MDMIASHAAVLIKHESRFNNGGTRTHQRLNLIGILEVVREALVPD